MTTHYEDHKENLTGHEALEKVRALLGNFRSAMLTTVVDGRIHARPMGLQGKADEFDGTLWFFADDRSAAVAEIRAGASASLILQSDGDSAYLQLEGAAMHDPDRTKMEELYTTMLRTWFPDGLNDPHLTLIRFESVRGSYWDSPGGFVQVLAAFTKALLTGRAATGGSLGDLELRR